MMMSTEPITSWQRNSCLEAGLVDGWDMPKHLGVNFKPDGTIS